MKLYRSFLIILSFAVFGICSLFLNFFLFRVVKIYLNNEIKYKEFASKIIQYLWHIFINFLVFLKLIKIKINNKEGLKNIKNKIIVATHPSFIDIIILIALIPKSTCFVKDSLTKNPIINRLVNSIFISSTLPLDEMQKKATEMLDMGFNIIIFPMGIRHRENEFPKIKKGASLIAVKTGANIIPIRITTDEDFLFINQPFYEGGDHIVTFNLELKEEIVTNKLYNDSEIVYKQNVTKEIKKQLYLMDV